MAKRFRSPRAQQDVQLRDLTPEQRADLKQLRAIAMAIATRILEMLPQPETAAKPDGKGANLLPAEFDRLLGRTDGIVDSLERLAKVVIRVIDKEREYSESVATNCIDVPRMAEAELDRRIAAELDFIADQRRVAAPL
jgi:hypothetical protein